MITIIFGAPGSGKSTFNTYLLIQEYRKLGRVLLNNSRKRIEELNENRETPLSFPDRPPLYADFQMSLKVGYEKTFKPDFVDGFHLGLGNDDVSVLNVPPGSKIHLSEVQRYYDSRKSQTFPEWVSRWFEMHRHYGVDVTMDIQRSSLVDVNIRDLCRHYIEIESMTHTLNDLGSVMQTKFKCREFACYQDVEDYTVKKSRCYDKTTYVYDGDIFRCFNSCAYFNKFVPTDNKDFTYMEFGNNSVTEPKEYRHPAKKEKKKEVT